MLPVTAWPPVRPGFWTSPFSAPVTVNAGKAGSCGVPLPKGCWLIQAGANQVVFIIRPPDPMEPYWRTPGTGIVHGSGCPPKFPTWPQWPPLPRAGWMPTNKRCCNPRQDTRKGRCSPPSRPADPPGTQRMVLLNAGATGIVFADGQNVVILGGGQSTCIQVFSV